VASSSEDNKTKRISVKVALYSTHGA